MLYPIYKYKAYVAINEIFSELFILHYMRLSNNRLLYDL